MTGVPSNNIVPFIGVDFDTSQYSTGPETMPIKGLLIGQRLAAGTVAADTPFLATSAAEVATKAGAGSMLHRMAIYWFKNNQTVPATFIGLDDAEGTLATHAFTITGPATATGTFAAIIAGQTYAITVASADTATEIGDALIAVINADTELQCTAANVTGTVTLTCVNDGVIAGDLDVRFVTDLFPTGVSVGAVTPTPGTVDPDVVDAIAGLGSEWYNVVVNPFTDDTVETNVTTMEEWAVAQDDIMVMQDMMIYQCVRDTLANLITYGAAGARNSQFMSTFDGENYRVSTYEMAAAVAGAVAQSVQSHVAIPVHRMDLAGVYSRDIADRRTPTEQNQLATNGIASLSDDNGTQTFATVTMYLKNVAGAPSTVWQQQNKVFQRMKARYTFRNWMLTKYPRALLSNNADDTESGVQVLTPNTAKDEAIAWFMAYQGEIFEGGAAALEAFKQAVTTSRSGSTRMVWNLPSDFIDQFVVGSTTISVTG